MAMRIEPFLEQSPIFQTNRIARRMDASLTGALANEEVSVLEAMVLAAIFLERQGPDKRGVKPTQLAETFETTRGNVSHCISSLEAKGFVERRIDPADARALQLLLKPQGRRKAARVVGILDRVQREIEVRLGAARLARALDEMKTVEDLCAHIVHGG
jgi:DNA-binding MarR family transcriptional regulator